MAKLRTVEELHAMALEHVCDCLIDIEGASLIPTFKEQIKRFEGTIN